LTFGPEGESQQTLTIIGVTADFPTSQMSTVREQLLLPLAQHPNVRQTAVPADESRGMPPLMLIARSDAGQQPAKLTAALENVVRELDPEFQRVSIVTGAGLRKNSMDETLAYAAGGAIAILVAVLASFAPARRAASVAPMVAMRSE
jgi:hypothetical protein